MSKKLIALLVLAPSVAFAQGTPYNQTLDSQLARIKDGKPNTEATAPKKIEAPATHVPASVPVAATPPVLADQAIPALPLNIKTAGDVTYLAGGVSDESEAELKARINEFNIRVILTSVDGGYLGGVAIRLLDSVGNVLVTDSNAGPYFYATVKPGKYTVEATESGVTKKITVSAPAKGGSQQQIRF